MAKAIENGSENKVTRDAAIVTSRNLKSRFSNTPAKPESASGFARSPREL
jgi:hypothetical protein